MEQSFFKQVGALVLRHESLQRRPWWWKQEIHPAPEHIVGHTSKNVAGRSIFSKPLRQQRGLSAFFQNIDLADASGRGANKSSRLQFQIYFSYQAPLLISGEGPSCDCTVCIPSKSLPAFAQWVVPFGWWKTLRWKYDKPTPEKTWWLDFQGIYTYITNL